jgi:kinesin family protein 18/19
MLGTEDEEGIMVLTLKELFAKIAFYSSEREYKVKLWYIEIYNENIRDLVSNTDEYLDLREDPNKGVSISNISELNVTSCKDIMQLLKKGNKNRTQEATNANETSSRSHAILQVQVEYKDKVTGLEAEIKVGKLNLIDLAGSERASATQNRGIRLIEGANINRSLLTLGNCINALCEANEKGTKPYVPYRDSKLTRLLKVFYF